MSNEKELKINYDGVALEFLLEHPKGMMELGQVKNKAKLLSVLTDTDFEVVYDGILVALQKLHESGQSGLE